MAKATSYPAPRNSSSIFNVAIADGLAETNPVKAKLFAKENNARVRFLSPEEETRLREEIGYSPRFDLGSIVQDCIQAQK